MARYERLPIYKAALDMTVHIEKLVAGFSRYHKYTLGTELREASRGMLTSTTILLMSRASGSLPLSRPCQRVAGLRQQLHGKKCRNI
jgi:hypothetical protein